MIDLGYCSHPYFLHVCVPHWCQLRVPVPVHMCLVRHDRHALGHDRCLGSSTGRVRPARPQSNPRCVFGLVRCRSRHRMIRSVRMPLRCPGSASALPGLGCGS